jgi:hypothetical protein
LKPGLAVGPFVTSIAIIMSDLTLWCLVIDETCEPAPDMFKVKVAPNDDIDDLKEQIIASGKQPVLKERRAGELLLWKPEDNLACDHPTFDDAVRALRLNYHTRKADNGRATRLFPASQVSEVFGEELKEKRVHVLVQLPGSTTPGHFTACF